MNSLMTTERSARMSRLTRAFACAVALAGLSAGIPAMALSECDGECPPPSPSPPPALPMLPNGTDISGNFFTYPNGNVVQGGAANGGWYTFGGGAAAPHT